MATANPTQLYEKVSEIEVPEIEVPRYDHLNGQMFYQDSQEEALSRNARQYGRPQQCEQRCQWSHFERRTICDWWCPRM